MVLKVSHKENLPEIGPGFALTVTMVISMQLVGFRYVIEAVPDVIPDTTPEVRPTLATDGSPLLHVPPATLPVRVRVFPEQTLPPVVGAPGFTVTVAVPMQLPE